MSSMDALHSQIQDELGRIITLLEGMMGRKSRWTGEVVLSDDPTFRGKLLWNGDVAFSKNIISTDLRWRTSIHEALHTFSQGLKPSDYADLLGWEEGVVENLQRRLRPAILTHLNIFVAEDVFQPAEARHEYNRYIDALDGIRGVLKAPDLEFYLELLAVALKDRPKYVIERGQQFQGQVFKNFQRRFALAFTVLRGD